MGLATVEDKDLQNCTELWPECSACIYHALTQRYDHSILALLLLNSHVILTLLLLLGNSLSTRPDLLSKTQTTRGSTNKVKV